MSRLLRIVRFTGSFAVLAIGLVTGTSAHPHIIIAADVSLEVRAGALVAIRQRWTFDEAHRRSAFEEFDKNRDGILDSDELDAFRAAASSTMDRFSNFTTIDAGRAKARMQKVEFTGLDMTSAHPVIEFRLALVEPLILDQPVVIQVYDPTFYSAFSIPTATVLRVETEAGLACTATITESPKGGEQLKAYRAFAATFGASAARLVKPQSISLSCGAQ